MNSGPAVKILAMGLVAFFVWCLWPVRAEKSVSTNQVKTPDSSVSAIQPITIAEAANITEGGSLSGQLESRVLDAQANDDLKKRFEQAFTNIQAQKSELAIKQLNDLINDYPSVPELYANLGALYARRGDPEQARQTFKKGLEQNQKAKILFDGLQEVHGALAANAYQKALDATSPNAQPASVTLPLTANVSTAVDQEQTIAALQAQLNNKQQPDASAGLEKINELQAQLDVSAQNLVALKLEYEADLQKLQAQLTEQAEALVLSQTAEREAQARVIRAEVWAAARLNEATAKIKTEKQTLIEEKDLIIARQQQEVERMRKQADADAIAQQVAGSQTGQPANPSQDKKAVELVKRWARDWSAQDVTAYIDHYADNYTSGSSISREEWLEQRRARLTNNEFTEVVVREFVIQDLGEQFSVTFTQHYRSNTVDDTSRKRLVFDKLGEDWSQAKIVKESRVQG